jgi:hypothetical protein
MNKKYNKIKKYISLESKLQSPPKSQQNKNKNQISKKRRLTENEKKNVRILRFKNLICD